MRKRPIQQDVQDISEIKENIYKERIIESSLHKSPQFTMKELDCALKTQKMEKAKISWDTYVSCLRKVLYELT